MKKMIFVLLCFIAISITANAQKIDIQNLVGKWDAIDATQAHGTLEILDSTHIYLTFNGQKKPILHYTADFTKTPVWFDFALKEGGDTIHLKSILRIISRNKLQWQVFTGDNRPDYFSKDYGNMVYLIRKR